MILAWVVDERGLREEAPDEAVRLAKSGQANAWVDFESEDEAAARNLLGPLNIHPLVIEDMVMEVNRPKVDNYGSYIYLVIHSARWDDERPTLREIDVVLGERFLITYHDGTTRSIDACRDVLPRRPELLQAGPARLFHFMLDVLMDHYLPIMDRIAEEIDEFEERLFDESQTISHLRVLRLKRGMSALRRIVGPQRDTILALTRDEFRPVPPDIRPYLRDVYDRLARVSDLLDSFRDEVGSLLELQVALVSNRLNEVIKRLTVIATIGLPLTLITAYYGMNFRFPEYQWPHPWIYILGVLFLTAGATWWFLKRKRWL